MRVMKDHCHCPPPAVQHSLVAWAQQSWNEWEIQCLVLVSFSLQVFLLFAAGFRKRHRSRVLSFPLWLAYLSADSVAVFVLGRLTLHAGEPRHQLVLFWAPFMLLHLGGQETIAAYSMQDCALWTRHLLNLTTQTALAVYVVGKQWRGGEKHVLVPVVLIFISGMIKYTERTWVLRRAGSREHQSGYMVVASASWELGQIITDEERCERSEKLVKVAVYDFILSFSFLMDLFFSRFHNQRSDVEYRHHQGVHSRIMSHRNAANAAYKLAEVQLSVIYDHLYTKFGGDMGVLRGLRRVATLLTTSTSLTLFVVAHADGRYNAYSLADVTICYILLAGAVGLEASSIVLWLSSSYWSYAAISYLRDECPCKAIQLAGTLLLRIVKCHAPSSSTEWSGKLPQHNLINACIRQKHAGLLERWARSYLGVERDYAAPVDLSQAVKKMLFDQLLQISTAASGPELEPLDFTRFNGQWAHRVAADLEASRKVLEVSNVQGSGFDFAAILWHLVTDIFLVTDADDMSTTDGSDQCCAASLKFCRDISNYVIYLVAKCKVMLSVTGTWAMHELGPRVPDRLEDRDKFIHKVVDEHILWQDSELYSAQLVSRELLRMDRGERWKLIRAVWVEMLIYVAYNAGAGFHSKHLSTGGEFVTHVKMLLYILGIQLRARK